MFFCLFSHVFEEIFMTLGCLKWSGKKEIVNGELERSQLVVCTVVEMKVALTVVLYFPPKTNSPWSWRSPTLQNSPSPKFVNTWARPPPCSQFKVVTPKIYFSLTAFPNYPRQLSVRMCYCQKGLPLYYKVLVDPSHRAHH